MRNANSWGARLDGGLPAKSVGLRVVRIAAIAGAALAMGCTVGPDYHKPTSSAPTAYKEMTPAQLKATDGWKVAEPKDSALHGNWWEMFNDPLLNSLEQQVNVSNQNIAIAFSNFLAARAVVKEARAQYAPTVNASTGVTAVRTQTSTASPGVAIQYGTYSAQFDASWTADLWGRVRRLVEGNIAAAQASAADLENQRLTAQAEVAVDYFQLCGQDSLKQMLDSTVSAYAESLSLQKVLFETGIASEEAVAQADIQLQLTVALDINVEIARTQLEHAIALLVGQPASTFSIPVAPLKANPPAIPIGVPSQLLERRPDIAASERLVAQANAQIGVAKAAYYPTFTLGGPIGFESAYSNTLFGYPSLFWSVGPALAETVYDGGLRAATVEQFKASYDASVATYRQTVLTAFQQVEDALAGLRILSRQIQQQNIAITAAQRNLNIATDRYKLGIDPYLNVITAQTTLVSSEQTQLTLHVQQMTTSVQLVEALGGGWDASKLPSEKDIAGPPPKGPPPSPQ